MEPVKSNPSSHVHQTHNLLIFHLPLIDTTVNSSHLSRILVQDLDLPDALLGPIEHSITSQIEDAIMYGAGNEYGSLMLILNGSDLENEIVKTAVERILIKVCRLGSPLSILIFLSHLHFSLSICAGPLNNFVAHHSHF